MFTNIDIYSEIFYPSIYYTVLKEDIFFFPVMLLLTLTVFVFCPKLEHTKVTMRKRKVAVSEITWSSTPLSPSGPERSGGLFLERPAAPSLLDGWSWGFIVACLIEFRGSGASHNKPAVLMFHTNYASPLLVWDAAQSLTGLKCMKSSRQREIEGEEVMPLIH